MGGGTLAAKVAEKIANPRAGRAPAEPARDHPATAAPTHARATTDANAEADAPPEWIDSVGEDAYLGEQAQAAAAELRARPDEPADEDEKADRASAKDLPPLDALLPRIPPAALEALESLFRARFTTVRKIPRKQIDPESRV